METGHTPVMKKEIEQFLISSLPDKAIVVDATLGAGGHAECLLKHLASHGGRLIAFDMDKQSLEQARQRLAEYGNALVCVNENFANIAAVLLRLGIDKINGLVADLGISSMQVDNGERGFSFQSPGPLDMRMGESAPRTAAEIVNTYSEEELFRIIKTYGEERWSRRIVRRIIFERENAPITTTDRLADIIIKAVPVRFRYKSKIHPATRTFQALRMEVNEELDSLEQLLEDMGAILAPGGRAAIISFHSLEDRMVKQVFRELKKTGEFEILTKKPLTADEEEIDENRRARSAKLRVIEKTKGGFHEQTQK
ncbi:MAG: 16S rRNA (cytosine(1402)-N(4))-methyltransferase RsmH [Candidatus Auribacterota bacterium]|nr:16S rRNA (cytosine(1402)-N(4))-methyltransferase RsmH [Candidatus Auribacterota bacterium]